MNKTLKHIVTISSAILMALSVGSGMTQIHANSSRTRISYNYHSLYTRGRRLGLRVGKKLPDNRGFNYIYNNKKMLNGSYAHGFYNGFTQSFEDNEHYASDDRPYGEASVLTAKAYLTSKNKMYKRGILDFYYQLNKMYKDSNDNIPVMNHSYRKNKNYRKGFNLNRHLSNKEYYGELHINWNDWNRIPKEHHLKSSKKSTNQNYNKYKFSQGRKDAFNFEINSIDSDIENNPLKSHRISNSSYDQGFVYELTHYPNSYGNSFSRKIAFNIMNSYRQRALSHNKMFKRGWNDYTDCIALHNYVNPHYRNNSSYRKGWITGTRVYIDPNASFLPASSHKALQEYNHAASSLE